MSDKIKKRGESFSFFINIANFVMYVCHNIIILSNIIAMSGIVSRGFLPVAKYNLFKII